MSVREGGYAGTGARIEGAEGEGAMKVRMKGPKFSDHYSQGAF